MLRPATPTRRLFPALWLVFLGRFGNTRAATFFPNLIALLRHLSFLPPFSKWFLYRFSRCAFWLHTAIMSRRFSRTMKLTILAVCFALALSSCSRANSVVIIDITTTEAATTYALNNQRKTPDYLAIDSFVVLSFPPFTFRHRLSIIGLRRHASITGMSL